jgi:hypothetical protein
MLNLQLWHLVLTAAVLLFLGAFVGGRIAIIRTLTQTEDDSPRNVSEVLDEAARAVADRPHKEWADRITYLLKALDHRSVGEEYRATLEAVQDAIVNRLVTDRW